MKNFLRQLGIVICILIFAILFYNSINPLDRGLYIDCRFSYEPTKDSNIFYSVYIDRRLAADRKIAIFNTEEDALYFLCKYQMSRNMNFILNEDYDTNIVPRISF